MRTIEFKSIFWWRAAVATTFSMLMNLFEPRDSFNSGDMKVRPYGFDSSMRGISIAKLSAVRSTSRLILLSVLDYAKLS